MTSPIRILIVDDHALIRDGLKRLLEQSPRLTPVGDAASGPEAVELAKELQPDVALVDLVMPEMDGIETARQLELACPDTRVIILTGAESENSLIQALGAGVYGYVLKSLPFSAVAQAIEMAIAGEVTLPAELSRQAFAQTTRMPSSSTTPSSGRETLTEREREILCCLADGETNRQIASRLVISEHTVRAHLRNLMSKLGVTSRAQAAALASRHGLPNHVTKRRVS
ncbi:MAG: response regulator transcription factor [Chloroflexi bacterium]|nr:response regulator transcription factor [Chloroflexota bacterium]